MGKEDGVEGGMTLEGILRRVEEEVSRLDEGEGGREVALRDVF